MIPAKSLKYERGINMYDVKSKKAEEFISHEEILDTLQWAKDNKSNYELISSIIDKAETMKGLSHREGLFCLNAI